MTNTMTPTATNQASEDELRKELDCIYDWYELIGEQHSTNPADTKTYDDLSSKIIDVIRTEKLKLLDRLSSHQEDLFWWTGGEYEKTKAVDMRAIAAERELLTKQELDKL